MLLKGKTAVVYGAGGKVGGAVARAFAADGARVFLAGRHRTSLEPVAADIAARGGEAELAELDVLQPELVDAHLKTVVDRAGRLDVSFNAVSFRGDLQGRPLREMPVEDFALPVSIAARAHFLTGTAAARQMALQRSGVIVMLSTSAAGLSGRDRKWHKTGGFGVACAAIEELSRSLAGELGPLGVRVICLRPDGISETWSPEDRAEGSASKTYMDSGTLMGSLPTLVQVADAAVWAASDRSAAMTGAIMNLTRGSVMGLG